jgi:hypothetical protein
MPGNLSITFGCAAGTTTTSTTTTTTTVSGTRYRYSVEDCNTLTSSIIVVNTTLTIGNVYKLNGGSCGTVTGYLGTTGLAVNTTATEVPTNSCGDATCPQL